MKVHQSGIKTWRRCHKLYDYKYNQELEKVVKGAPLQRGTLVHAMIEAKANGEDPWDVFDVWCKEHIEDQDLIEQTSAIMEGYFNYYKNDNLTPVAIGGKFAEHKLAVPLVEDIEFEGIIDMVSKDEQSRVWLMDHKTHKNLPSDDFAAINMQALAYVWLMREAEVEYKPHGICWNYIRWKEPQKPKVLKSGLLSRSSIDTTWPIYRRAIIENGEDPADYKDMEEKLINQTGEFFTRKYMPINESALKIVMEDMKQSALDIRDNSKKLKDRNLTRDCSWCEFYPLCQAELRGLDTEMMRKTDYKKRVRMEDKKDEE